MQIFHTGRDVSSRILFTEKFHKIRLLSSNCAAFGAMLHTKKLLLLSIALLGVVSVSQAGVRFNLGLDSSADTAHYYGPGPVCGACAGLLRL